MNLRSYTLAGFFLMLSVFSCTTKKQETAQGKSVERPDSASLKFTVEEAPEWTALFKRNSGWFGGDGIFAIPQNGVDTPGNHTKTLLLFSDTMIGEIKNDSLQPGYTMINNSVAYVDGAPEPENIQFYWDKDANGKAKTIFIPHTPHTQKGEYYWLGDGFVNTELNNNTYIFGYRIRNVETTGAFGFEEVGNTLIIIPEGSTPPFKDHRQIDTPFYFTGKTDDDKGSFGAGIFVNTEKAGAPDPDGYVYVYGIRGKSKNLVVARVLPKNFETFGAWTFWDGSSWNSDMQKMASITNRLSNELSVTPLPDRRYALVFQVDGIGNEVGLRIGSSPVGPFGPIISLYKTDVSKQDKDFFPYNAKAHFNLSAPGELLISYNVNSFDFQHDIVASPHLYRPRFIRLILQ